jgi:hypothetical protein
MVAQTQQNLRGKHRGIVGLQVGSADVQRYLSQTPPRIDPLTIELELDHLRIVCELEPTSLPDSDHPQVMEIYDDRLSSWLKSKRDSGKMAMDHALLDMIPNGKQSFRLIPLLQTTAKDTAIPAFPPSFPS